MDIENTKAVFDPNLFQISWGTHNGKKVIWIKFDYDQNLIQ
ncbi:hypothetical protein SAMN05660206_11299 [Sphingobacterium wenxiniae]|uniref:Uncharacterized protein n=1 Tax=Sphingobacterium wenxiniae TaxID=683125 RepID=A0A1I6VBT5_9SPHI|nr:hypothetical protein SAMN05660206_11299 [Sphingobacterium wenxiniae]